MDKLFLLANNLFFRVLGHHDVRWIGPHCLIQCRCYTWYYHVSNISPFNNQSYPLQSILPLLFRCSLLVRPRFVPDDDFGYQTGPTVYRSRTVFEDATPELVRDFFWDDEFRPKWDPMLAYFKILDECPHTGMMVVHWIKKVGGTFNLCYMYVKLLSPGFRLLLAIQQFVGLILLFLVYAVPLLL